MKALFLALIVLLSGCADMGGDLGSLGAIIDERNAAKEKAKKDR